MKGEISGNEDLHIDGTADGLVQLDERKLTIGTTANVTADIFAGEVVVYGKVKGNVRAKGRIEIKKDASVIGDFDYGADHDRRRRLLQRVDRDREERRKGRRQKRRPTGGIVCAEAKRTRWVTAPKVSCSANSCSGLTRGEAFVAGD